jgi:hypothetical protein
LHARLPGHFRETNHFRNSQNLRSRECKRPDRGLAFLSYLPPCPNSCMLLALSLRASLRPSLSSALLFARVAQSSRQNICTMSDEVAKAQQSAGPTVRPLSTSSPIAVHHAAAASQHTAILAVRSLWSRYHCTGVTLLPCSHLTHVSTNAPSTRRAATPSLVRSSARRSPRTSCTRTS